MTQSALAKAATRFYGMPIDDKVLSLRDEGLADLASDELVAAHLLRNYSYFGAIDKTLSGFVILDDEGDNYTLVDVRGAGQIFWQDHETRELYLTFDSVDDYLECQREIAAAEAEARAADDSDDEEDDDERDVDVDAIQGGYRPQQLRLGDRAVPTHALAARYQWLVWGLAQPLTRDGKPIETIRELVGTALGQYEQAFVDADALSAAFRDELPTLRDDAHLAIYWLLHATLRCEPERLRAVLEAIEPTRARWSELLSAFVARLSTLGVDGDLELVPDFRARRALILLVRANRRADSEPDAALDDYLTSLRMDPHDAGLSKALPIVRALDGKGVKAPGALADRVRRMLAALDGRGDDAPALSLLRAKLDAQAGAERSVYADAVVRAAADAEQIESIGLALEASWPIYMLVGDAAALDALAQRLYAFDDYHRRVLKICQRAQALAGHTRFGDDAQLAERLAHAEASIAPLGALIDEPESFEATVQAIDSAALREVVARRVLMRAALFRHPAPMLWAFDTVAKSDDAQRFSLLARGYVDAMGAVQKQLLARVGEAIDGPQHPMVDLLFDVLERAAEGVDEDDFASSYALGKTLESTLATLSSHAAAPEIFARFLKLARGPGRKVPETIVKTLLNPFSEQAYVVDRLSDSQAAQAAELLLELREHESMHVANGAGHQLYRFNHPGGAEVCIAALSKFGERCAAAHARGERDKVAEDIVANLYAALRAMANKGCAPAREAIIERLFSERHSYWRLGNAIGELQQPGTHERAMQLLEQRRDADGAAAYAAALANFVKKAPPLAELGEAVSRWALPDDADQRARLKYVLLEATRAGLEAKAHAAVRAAYAAAQRISEPPYSPYHSVDRGKDFVDPFDAESKGEADDELRAALARVVSGEADTAAAELRAAADAQRAKGKPKARISDEDLGALAGVTVAARLYFDKASKEIWFRDSDGGAHYFDGYDVVEPPFSFVDGIRTGGAAGKAFYADVTAADERLMFWDKRGQSFIEWTRHGARLTLRRGRNNAAFDVIGVEMGGAEQAGAQIAAARASAPRGFAETSPWYVPARGAVVRTFYTPKADGSYNSDGRKMEAVLDGALSWGRKQLDGDEAARAHVERMEAECLRAGGYVSCIEWMERLRRAEDLDLLSWLQKRVRQDARGVGWHVDALRDIARYVAEHDLDGLLEGIELSVAEPATQADIDAVASTRAQPLPQALVALWQHSGGARWRCGKRSGELLGPRALLEQRDRARAHGKRWLHKVPEDARPQQAQLFERLDALTLLDGELDTLIVDAERNDERVFTKAGYSPNDMWWEKALGWMLATGLLSELVEAMVAHAPTLRLMWYGQRYDGAAEHRLYRLDDKQWEVRFDEAAKIMATRSGKVGKPGKVSIKRFDDAAKARKAYDKAVSSYVKKGYAVVEGATM